MKTRRPFAAKDFTEIHSVRSDTVIWLTTVHHEQDERPATGVKAEHDPRGGRGVSTTRIISGDAVCQNKPEPADY